MPRGSTVYTAKKAATLTNPITNDSIFLQSENSAFAAFVSAYQGALVGGSSNLDGSSIYIRASGKVTTGTSSTLIVTLYYSAAAKTAITYNGTGVTATASTFTSAAYATTSGNWMLETTLVWDYTSKTMGGYFVSTCGPTPVIAGPTVVTALTTVDLSLPGCGFALGAHFGSTNASNVATLSQFTLEVM
jgi:hypothetical protein